MSELDLISNALKNESWAQAKLFHLYKSYWYMICLRYNKNQFDADDCLQNALVQIFTKLDQFDQRKGEFKSWSSRIVVNESLMFLRQKRSFDEIFDVVDTADEMEPSLHDEFPLSQERLTGLIQKLPTGYRTVFNLYVMEGYSHPEIASILEISIGTSKSQLSKARKMLKAEVELVF